MFREKDGLVMWAMKPFEDRIKPTKKSVCHLDMNHKFVPTAIVKSPIKEMGSREIERFH